MSLVVVLTCVAAALLAVPTGGCGRLLRRHDAAPEVKSRGIEDPALLLELLGSMLEAGSPVPRALAVVARVAGRSSEPLGRTASALALGAPWAAAWPMAGSGDAVREIRSALRFAVASGAPSSALIFARARQIRRTRHRELERRAAALGVRLVLPLGLCSLPAFLCLGVVPVLLSMLPGGGGS